MNKFDEVFNKAIDKKLISFKNDADKKASYDLHNLRFKLWLEKNYTIDTSKNYDAVCIFENFKSYYLESVRDLPAIFPKPKRAYPKSIKAIWAIISSPFKWRTKDRIWILIVIALIAELIFQYRHEIKTFFYNR